jgi:hypothetical protein
MDHRFTHHYTLAQARALLPQVREWLRTLESLQPLRQKDEERLRLLMARGGDAGGKVVDRWVRTLAEFRAVLSEFECREIQLKNLDRGLLDFPALIGGREVFLCWEKDEPDIEHWHDLEAGYAGRKPL